MLVFDPRRRISAAAGLAHEYLAPHHDSSDEPVAAEVFDWSFNDEDLPVDRWKVMIYSEVLGECMNAQDPTLYLQRMRKRPTYGWNARLRWRRLPQSRRRLSKRGQGTGHKRASLRLWRPLADAILVETDRACPSAGCPFAPSFGSPVTPNRHISVTPSDQTPSMSPRVNWNDLVACSLGRDRTKLQFYSRSILLIHASIITYKRLCDVAAFPASRQQSGSQKPVARADALSQPADVSAVAPSNAMLHDANMLLMPAQLINMCDRMFCQVCRSGHQCYPEG
jgi:p38 MAP kinase